MTLQQTAPPIRSPFDAGNRPYFRLLGSVEIMAGGDYTPRAPKLRNVLTLLLLRANRVVHLDTLIDELWGATPPLRAVTIVQTYVYELRKLFAAGKLDPPGGRLLVTKPPGYVLLAEPWQVDAEVFEQLVRQGTALLEKGRAQRASEMLTRALDMWTGPALADVPRGKYLEAHAVHLEERRMTALQQRIQADMSLGKSQELVAELRSLTCLHPFNEWFHGQLISALGHSGRRGEALAAYRALRTVLKEELGIDPSPELQRLQQQILSLGQPGRHSARQREKSPLWLAS
jgi:SARP family transcriptional regulator, regulator of embCAB operon